MGCAPPAADTSALAKRYGVAGKILLTRLRTFLAFPEWFYLKLPVNTMTEPRPTPGGLATQYSSAGHFDLGDDQAMVVTVPVAGRAVAPYQGIQLGSMWYISLDYINHQTSLNADQARTDPDGQMRFVISERDPGLANWLERTGHSRGYVQFRWQRLSSRPRGRRRPGVEVVAFDDLPPRLPYYASAHRRRGVHGANRRAPGRGGREDAGLMAADSAPLLLRARSWWFAASAPGSAGRRGAERRAGADLVLAARTEGRLEEVAAEVTAMGRRASP